MAVIKGWLRNRWEMLFPILEVLTVDQEAEIERVCQEEIQNWRDRPTLKSKSSFKEPMTDTRNAIRERFPVLTDANSWFNPKENEREHIALKYMNYSDAEWAEMNRPSDKRFHERLENQQLLDYPDQIVAKADELLGSSNWTEVVVGLAVVTGRRLAEIMKVGEIYPKTLHTVIFSGQLKRKDAVMKPYEIPVLVDASRVLAAWSGVRKMVDCSTIETDAISKTYGTELGEVAERHFSDLVPVRNSRDKLFSQLFRAVYPRLAIFYFCPATVSDIAYLSTVLGHYWSNGVDEEQQRNYVSSLHYFDYKIGDGAGNIDGRQGTWLGKSGVEILEAFKPKLVTTVKGRKKVQETQEATKKPSQTGFSSAKPKADTRERINRIMDEVNARIDDDALRLLCDEHYILQQITSLLSPVYEQLGVDSPVGAVQALLGDGGAVQVDQKLAAHFKTSLVEVVGLLDDAASDSNEPVAYLRELVSAKRTFKKSYEKRHKDKDYSTLPTSQLRRTKMPGAAEERFRRAVDTLMEHNDSVTIPEFRRYISPAMITDLVGGRPGDAKDYIATRQAEIGAHHKKYGITPGYNRLVLQSVKVEVPEWPKGVTPSEVSEEEIEEEETGE